MGKIQRKKEQKSPKNRQSENPDAMVSTDAKSGMGNESNRLIPHFFLMRKILKAS
jgi:hypothetical protein